MIKAKKGLLITLFAAMMIFAFGATSAFAADQPTWSDDYTTVTVDSSTGAPDNYKYNTVREFQSDGSVLVKIDPATDVSWALPSVSTTYYDLNNAVFAKGSDTIKAEYTNGKYEKPDSLLFKVPSYVTNKSSAVAKDVTLASLNSTAKWQGKIVGDEEYDSTLATEQNFTLNLEVSYIATGSDVNFYGVVPAKAVKVFAKAPAATDVKFWKDEIPADGKGNVSAGTIEFNYDGEPHKLVSNEVAGFTVAYEVFNKETGKYDAVSECPTVTNVADTANVKVSVKDPYPATDIRHVADIVYNFTLKAKAAGAPTVGFDPDGNKGDAQYGAEGSEFDPYAFIVVTPADNSDKAIKAANEKAAKANEQAILDYFKDYYEITSEATKANPNVFALTIKAKELTADQTKELTKKYEALVGNFNPAKFDITTGYKTAEITVNAPKIVPEIEFVDSPTKVTYKAKKLKKKAASFTVTAECNTNAAITYKLINAPAKIKIDKASGEITLNKGLKKGTYKIRVKAFTTTDYDLYAEEYHDITVKVKK